MKKGGISMNVSEKNDLLRAKIPLIEKPDVLVLTRGIYEKFNDKEVADILQKVKSFSDFNEDNDPWKEHDFGSFDFNGEKIFWKIDNYNGQENLNLVLTIMLAEDY